MGIEIPGPLQWVAYLTGSEWPQGDETAMFRIGDDWRSASGDLAALIPDLNRVRSETLSVLMGETADAAEEQFAMLFDGDYSVDKLAEAMSALGDLADNAGTEIEYTKLQVLTSLAIAAAEIAYALACSPPTFGASLAWIPVTEAATMLTVRQLVAMLLRQIVQRLGEAMTKTLVKRLIKEGLQELAVGLGQELAIQGYQAAAGHRDGIDWKQAGVVGAASGIGGAAASPVGHGLGRALGHSDNAIAGSLKGALSGYGAGVVGNVAGTVATGGDLDAVSIFGGAASSAGSGGVHGARGAGGHGGPTKGNPGADHDSSGAPPDGGGPSPGDSGPSASGDSGNNGPTSTGASESSSNPTVSDSPTETAGRAGTSSQDAPAGAPVGSSTHEAGTHSSATSAGATHGDGGSPTALSPTVGDGGPPDAGSSSHPSTETPSAGDPTVQHGESTTDSGQQHSTDGGRDAGESRPAGDTTDATDSRPEGATPSQSTDHAPSDPAPSDRLTTDHAPVDASRSDPVAAPQSSSTPATSPSATPSAPGTSSTSNPSAQSTPSATTAGPATHASPSAAGTSSMAGRPSAGESPTSRTSANPAGAPSARVAEAAAGQTRSTTDGTNRPDGQHQRDDGPPSPESMIAAVAVTPVLPGAGGDTAPRTGQRRADGSDRIGAAHDRPGGERATEGKSPGSDDPRARISGDPPAPPRPNDVSQIVSELEGLRTNADDGDTATVHDRAQTVRDRWTSLSRAEQDALLDSETRDGHRSGLGDLDGLPAHVRDALNRHNLVEDMVRHHPDDDVAIRDFARHLDAHLANPDANPRPAGLEVDATTGRDLTAPPGKLARLAAAFTGESAGLRSSRNVDATWNAVYGYPEGGQPRQLYTYDPAAFDGDGRVAVVVGDLDAAGAVAVHSPGITTTVRSVEPNVDNAENHYLRARQERPALQTAVVSWIGYDAPSGLGIVSQTSTQTFAEAGGHRLAHDVAGMVGSRLDHPDIHLFGHSYGSTTTAYAGAGGRLAGYVSSVTLLGSPGAGPLTHASQFGAGVDVYVASSSRDLVTWAGATEGGGTNRVAGWIRGVGQGVDPAMLEFGAARLTSEYAAPELARGMGAHTNYFATENIGPDGRPVLLRDLPTSSVTESLDNFSHILTGNADQVNLEIVHRDPEVPFTDISRFREVEPGAGYGRNDCVPRTIEGFTGRHPDTTVSRVDGDHGTAGVPRSDYERALGTSLRGATLDDVIAATRRGESVIVVDTYRAEGLPDGHPGSHTYAVEPNPADPSRPLVYEGDARNPHPWPPRGIDHVAETRIATFHPDGTPTHPLTVDPTVSRTGDDQRIAGEHRDSDGDMSADHRPDGDYPPDHISHLLDLPTYGRGTLTDVEVRSVYLNGEQRMHALQDALVAQGVDAETLAHTMFEARNELRSWARELMSDRESAAKLDRESPNRSWDDIVAKYRERGLSGDQLYEIIAERSMASRQSVNERLGLDPNRPPPLPREAPEPRIGATHPDNARAGPDTQYAEEHVVEFTEGVTDNTIGKREEYERQIERQIDGLNEMTADELLHNMDTVRREGVAQTEAREQYRQRMLRDETDLAFELQATDPEALQGLSPVEYAADVVDDTMALLAALHEPDIVAGGRDVIGIGPDGLPSMGDTFVNSSIGSQWRHRVADLRAYAEEMVALGHGGVRLNVRWLLNARA